MSRPKLAFVASGGATKGIAHLGALKAIEELGLRPDIFVGASTGAVVAAFCAQGVKADEMVDWLRPWPMRRRGRAMLTWRHFLGLPSLEQMARPGWLTSGLFSIERFQKHLRKALPMDDFRQLDRELYVTATDVDGRGRAVFGRGKRQDVPISEAVAASCCAPLLFRPKRIGDRYYLDGELTKTLSLDLAVGAGADVVVISNVYRPHVSAGDHKSIALKGPFAVGRQSLNIVLSEKERRGIDLLHQTNPNVTVLDVAPDLGEFSFTSRREARKLLQRGYREALRVLASAKRRGVFDIASNVGFVGRA